MRLDVRQRHHARRHRAPVSRTTRASPAARATADAAARSAACTDRRRGPSTMTIDWTDRRPISTMPFGADTPETSRADTVTIVRGILTACGCTIADDINKLGCTGLAAHVEKVVAFIAQL